MEIRYKNTKKDYENATDDIVEQKIDEISNKNKKLKNIEYKLPLIFLIMPILGYILEGSYGLKTQFLTFVFCYVLFFCAFTLFKVANKNNQKKIFKKKFHNMDEYIDITLNVLSDELILENNRTTKRISMNFIKLIQEIGGYVHIEFLDESFEIIPFEAFNGGEEIENFISLIKDSIGKGTFLKIEDNKEFISTIKYKMTKENLLAEYDFIKTLKYFKEFIKGSKNGSLKIQIIFDSFIVIFIYFVYKPMVPIAIIFSVVLLLYGRFFKDDKDFDKDMKKKIDEKWNLGLDYTINLSEDEICVCTKNIISNYKINETIKCTNNGNYELVTIKDMTILVNIPKEAFESEEDRKIFINTINNKN